MNSGVCLLLAAVLYVVAGDRPMGPMHRSTGHQDGKHPRLPEFRSDINFHEHEPLFDHEDSLLRTGHEDHRLIMERPSVCPSTCPSMYRPVCASDGRTYKNICRLNLASCRSGRSLYVIYEGRC